ncbi:MAG: leucine-rich repeat domain-containing protein [Paludibacteraceae bacterium]|nr:leucine-rich repeat domain-containing protein [Paludibacteraceae bacterium]
MKKKIGIALALLLLGVLFYALVNTQRSNSVKSVNADANTEMSSTSFTYEVGDGGVVVLPDTITEIPSHAFDGKDIKRIILPKGLKKIGDYAFYRTEIEEIEIPGSVDSIGDCAFKFCHKLHKLVLNEGLVSIGAEAFERCDTLVDPFTLPSTVKCIGGFAFGYAPGTEVPIEAHYEREIARNITIPENSQLEVVYCDGLTFAKEIYVPKTLNDVSNLGHPFFIAAKDHPLFCSIDGVLYSKDTTVLISFPKERGGTYVMPSSVRTIKEYAFEYNTVLEKIVLSSNLISLSKKDSDLETFHKIPLTMLYSNLKEVEIQNNAKYKSINGVLFSHDLETLIYYPQGLQVEEYVVPNHVRYIGEGAFEMSQPKKIVLPVELQSVGKKAFFEPRGIRCIEFTGGKCDIGESAFEVFEDGETIDSIIFCKKVDAEAAVEEDSTGNEPRKIDGSSCVEMSIFRGDTNGVKYVDLGLPSGNLWAETNIGASVSNDCGDRYAWGETSLKKGNAYYGNYKYAKDVKGENAYTKYVLDKAYGYNGFVDHQSILELSDDAAHNILGGSWRIPTECDWQELIDYCIWKEAILSDRRGYLVYGKNGKTLFLPAYPGDFECKCYASSSISLNDQSKARVFHIDYDGNCGMTDYYRYNVFLLRPVCPVKK